MKKFFRIFFIFIIIRIVVIADNVQIPPNGSLKVAYQQLSEGKLSESIHSLELFCINGECTLTTITVNQCIDIGADRVFFPKAQSTNTRNGNLKILLVGKNFFALEENTDGAIFKYRFTFTTRLDPSLSNQFKSHTTFWFQDITDFSGSVIKDSKILNKVISWELVPLKGRTVTVKPGCDMRFFGIPE